MATGCPQVVATLRHFGGSVGVEPINIGITCRSARPLGILPERLCIADMKQEAEILWHAMQDASPLPLIRSQVSRVLSSAVACSIIVSTRASVTRLVYTAAPRHRITCGRGTLL